MQFGGKAPLVSISNTNKQTHTHTYTSKNSQIAKLWLGFWKVTGGHVENGPEGKDWVREESSETFTESKT